MYIRKMGGPGIQSHVRDVTRRKTIERLVAGVGKSKVSRFLSAPVHNGKVPKLPSECSAILRSLDKYLI